MRATRALRLRGRSWPWRALRAATSRSRSIPPAHPAEYRARRLDDPQLLAWVARWAGRPTAAAGPTASSPLAALGLRAELARARADWRARAGGRADRRRAPAARASQAASSARSPEASGQSPWVVSLGGPLQQSSSAASAAPASSRPAARTAVAEAELRLDRRGASRADPRSAALALAAGRGRLGGARREAAALLERRRRWSARASRRRRSRAPSWPAPAPRCRRPGLRRATAEAAVLAARARRWPGSLARPGARARFGGGGRRQRTGVRLAGATGRRFAGGPRADPTPGDRSRARRVCRRRSRASARGGAPVSRPDLGPGFIWDQGVHRWTLALALPNLLGFRNRAAIDAGGGRAAGGRGARRRGAGWSCSPRSSAAAGRCRGAALERAAADSQVAAAERGAGAGAVPPTSAARPPASSPRSRACRGARGAAARGRASSRGERSAAGARGGRRRLGRRRSGAAGPIPGWID